jgi:hypothetical protein
MSEERDFFNITEDVVTRSFGAAVFLQARGHKLLGMRSRDGSAMNAYFRWPASARPDIELFYRSRDELNRAAMEALKAGQEQPSR